MTVAYAQLTIVLYTELDVKCEQQSAKMLESSSVVLYTSLQPTLFLTGPGQTPINPLSHHIFLNLYTQQPQLIIPHNISTITLLQEL